MDLGLGPSSLSFDLFAPYNYLGRFLSGTSDRLGHPPPRARFCPIIPDTGTDQIPTLIEDRKNSKESSSRSSREVGFHLSCIVLNNNNTNNNTRQQSLPLYVCLFIVSSFCLARSRADHSRVSACCRNKS